MYSFRMTRRVLDAVRMGGDIRFRVSPNKIRFHETMRDLVLEENVCVGDTLLITIRGLTTEICIERAPKMPKMVVRKLARVDPTPRNSTYGS